MLHFKIAPLKLHSTELSLELLKLMTEEFSKAFSFPFLNCAKCYISAFRTKMQFNNSKCEHLASPVMSDSFYLHQVRVIQVKDEEMQINAQL